MCITSVCMSVDMVHLSVRKMVSVDSRSFEKIVGLESFFIHRYMYMNVTMKYRPSSI